MHANAHERQAKHMGGMHGEQRRATILAALSPDAPTKAQDLATQCGVSRQVIVQDVAMLRAAGEDILSTPRGYMLRTRQRNATRVFLCAHTQPQQLADELYAMVRRGGRVLDVTVEHPIYGEISAPLMLGTPEDVDGFVQALRQKAAQPLASVTGGLHMHTVAAATTEILDDIQAALTRIGVLVQTSD